MAQHLLVRVDDLAGLEEIVRRRQLPQSAVEPVGSAAREQDPAAVLDPQRRVREEREILRALARGQHGQLVLAAGRVRDT